MKTLKKISEENYWEFNGIKIISRRAIKDKEASGYWKSQHGILKWHHFNLDRVIEMALKKTDI